MIITFVGSTWWCKYVTHHPGHFLLWSIHSITLSGKMTFVVVVERYKCIIPNQVDSHYNLYIICIFSTCLWPLQRSCDSATGIHFKGSLYDGAIGSHYKLVYSVSTSTTHHHKSFTLYFIHFSQLNTVWTILFKWF